MANITNYEKAVELINKSSSILITTHTKPDGDSCGCMAALVEAFRTLGKKVKLLSLSPVPEWYEFLFSEEVSVLSEDITVEQLNQGNFIKPDLITIVDTNSYSQLPKFDQYLKRSDATVLVIDHHATSDGLGDIELVDTNAAAAGLIVLDLFKYANWPITEEIAQALFVGIATDTGWFQFGNTDSWVYRSCAQLVDAGVNPAGLYHDLYQNFSPARFKLMTATLNTLQLHLDDRYATQHLLQEDFQRTGAAYEDTENLIDQCQKIGTVEVAALFVELKDGRIKCSLRSRGSVDVSKIAQKFGGGGHPTAAGAYLPGPLEIAKKLIFSAVAEQFARIDGK